jgi:hypothetical protein
MHTIVVASNDAVRDNLVNNKLRSFGSSGQRLGHDEAEYGMVVVVFDVMGIQGIQWRTPLRRRNPYILPGPPPISLFSLDRLNHSPDSISITAHSYLPTNPYLSKAYSAHDRIKMPEPCTLKPIVFVGSLMAFPSVTIVPRTPVMFHPYLIHLLIHSLY